MKWRGSFPKSNRKIIIRGKIDIHSSHIHNHSLSWLCTGTSIKSRGAKQTSLNNLDNIKHIIVNTNLVRPPQNQIICLYMYIIMR
jgi:hypothetical protein